jgi:outer membrane protein assembly factor BamB
MRCSIMLRPVCATVCVARLTIALRVVVSLLPAATIGACGGKGDSNSPTETPNPGQTTLSPRLLHEFSPGSIGFYYNPPTLVGNAIYVGASRGIEYQPGTSNAFYKLSSTLAKVWEYPLGSKEVRGGAALDAAGNIYFAVEEGRFLGTSNPSVFWLYSLDPNGALRWTKQIRRTLPNVGMNNPAIAADNTIYIGGDKFYAFDTDGNQKWAYQEAAALLVLNAPIIDPAGNIYFSSQNTIYSLSPAGVRRWRVTTSGEPYSSPAFSVDHSKVFVPVGTQVYCLRASTGDVIWQFSPPGIAGIFRSTPAVDDNDNVYLGTKADAQSVFYAIRSDGTGLLWQNPIGADLYSSPAIGSDRTLYVGSEFGSGQQLHALDLATGTQKWGSPLRKDATWSSPAIADDGTLYIGSMDIGGEGGSLYSFRTDATGLLRTAGSPRFHGSNANNGRRN